jgi:hypothetical protein
MAGQILGHVENGNKFVSLTTNLVVVSEVILIPS